MTAKEKVIRESLKTATKRLAYLENIQNSSPAIDLISVRKEALQLLEQNKDIEERTSKSFIAKFEALAKKEEQCCKMIERQKKWEKDCAEIVKLMGEISDLKNELFYIEARKTSFNGIC